jgi:hypothetical protein
MMAAMKALVGVWALLGAVAACAGTAPGAGSSVPAPGAGSGFPAATSSSRTTAASAATPSWPAHDGRAELDALIERMIADRRWFATIGAAFSAAGVKANRIDLDISSANADAPGLIAAHFGVPAEVLNVTSDGTGIQLLHTGWVHLHIARSDGSEPADNDYSLDWVSDRPGPGSGHCGREVGFLVAWDGVMDLPCAPGGWTIFVTDGPDRIGSGHAVVASDATVDLAIALSR